MGDLGTFDGLRTSLEGEVLGEGGAPIPGLYAVGNDRASVMGGQLSGRRHHPRPDHDLRLPHRPPSGPR